MKEYVLNCCHCQKQYIIIKKPTEKGRFKKYCSKEGVYLEIGRNEPVNVNYLKNL